MRISSSCHASSSVIVWAPGAPSSSFAKEQNRHDATQTLVTSMRMLRLKYVRSPCRRSRTSLASWPTATQSGWRKSASAVVGGQALARRDLAANGVDHPGDLLRRTAACGRHAVTKPSSSRRLTQICGLEARLLAHDAELLVLGAWAVRACSRSARELVGAEAEGDLRELEPAACPVDPHADAAGPEMRATATSRRSSSPVSVVRRAESRRLGASAAAGRRVDAHLVADLLRAHAVRERADGEQVGGARGASTRGRRSSRARSPRLEDVAEPGRDRWRCRPVRSSSTPIVASSSCSSPRWSRMRPTTVSIASSRVVGLARRTTASRAGRSRRGGRAA